MNSFKFAAILFCLLLAEPLSAHPHVWIDVRAEAQIDQGIVNGVLVTWALDEEFSQLILSDNDQNGNGKIDPSEVPGLKKTYFDNLKLFHYFTHVFQGKASIPTPTVENFQASLLPSGKMQYQFFLPLKVPLNGPPFSLSFYDDTFYVDVEFEKKTPVTVKVIGNGQATVAFRPDKTKSYWGGEIVPSFAVFSWTPP